MSRNRERYSFHTPPGFPLLRPAYLPRRDGNRPNESLMRPVAAEFFAAIFHARLVL